MMQSCTVAFVLATLVGSGCAVPCAFDPTLAAIGEEYEFNDSRKLSVVGFAATVTYVSLPADASPMLKIIAASATPFVSTEGDVVTIGTASCAAGTTEPDAASSASSLSSGLMVSLFAGSLSLRGMGSLVCVGSLLGSLTGAYGQSQTCMPSLQIEISLPIGASAHTFHGETDHYLKATKDSVVWGYFDTNAVMKAEIASGETITVEVITHHSSHDYAKMIRGDKAVEDIFYWKKGDSIKDKPEPKLDGTGVHLITGPIKVTGAMPGDVVQVDILELYPRLNPATGKCYGTNSQKFAGYQYNSKTGFSRDGVKYVRTGGTEAITVFEFVEKDGKMAYGKPVYMYRFPNMTAADGSVRTFDNNPAVLIPHEYNMGYDGAKIEEAKIMYPEGFDGSEVTDLGGIKHLSPEEAKLDWRVPLRPHIGTLGVLPSNSAKYLDAQAEGGVNSIPPSRYGGNVDDWRIGKGGTMYYTVEVAGAGICVGDTHAAQGDAELAGTAMETSMTTKLRVTLHKAATLPAIVKNLNFPLLETSDQFVIHGYAYENFLDQLSDASDIFAEGGSLDKAMADCFIKTRNWLMDAKSLTEEETIAIMATSVDFGITQVVDGNWGVHADIDKWVFDGTDTPYDYSCTTSKSPHSRALRALEGDERRLMLEKHGVMSSPGEYAKKLYLSVTGGCAACAGATGNEFVAEKMLAAKLKFAQKMAL